MAKKRIIGASRLRRKLLRMPAEIQAELKATIREQAELVADEIRRRAPVSEEALPRDWEGKPRERLRDAVEVRISKNGLNARIGFIGRRVMKVFFFARFLEFGFRQKRGGKFIRLPFMFPAWTARREGARSAVKDATVRALGRVAARPMSDV